MVNFTFRGLMCPVMTPFNEDLSLNLKIIPEYAKFLSDNGVKGLLVNGTSGEGMSMTVAERKQVAEAWIEAVKSTGQHVMVQIGGCPLPDVLELAKHAETAGANSLLCLPELYFKPSTTSQLVDYLKRVGAEAPNTPLLYYHAPGFTTVNLHMGKFLNDATGKIPTLSGIKFTSSKLDEGMAAVRANDGKYAFFLGADEILAGAYTLGIDSAILTTLNMFAQINIDILEAVQKSDVAKARERQSLLNDILEVVVKGGDISTWVPTMKVAMKIVTSFDLGPVRPPLYNLDAQDVAEMRQGLQNLNLL